jgi:succinylglutamate desuccinylase
MFHSPIKNVALVGGTHGNELTGIFLVKKYEQNYHLIRRDSFEILTLLANTQAIAAGTRYIDTDLNRCFKPQDLQNPQLINYEQLLAKQIAYTISQSKIDLIIDLHSTTSNMGLTVILHNHHPYLLNLAAYLNKINPLVKVLQYPLNQDHPYLRNLCKLGFAIEVGAVAQGVLEADIFEQTEALIVNILDYLEQCNREEIVSVCNKFTIYCQIGKIDYPRNESGELQGMIHPQLQFQDYQPLAPGEPIFLTFDGQTITYEGESTVYPVFINEAAYYEKNIAFCLTQKHQITI